jgi:hypothetical protein
MRRTRSSSQTFMVGLCLIAENFRSLMPSFFAKR